MKSKKRIEEKNRRIQRVRIFLKKNDKERLQFKTTKSLIAWEMGTLLKCKNRNLEVLLEGSHE